MGSISEEMVKKLEDQAASFSWWWDSHNRPNQSQWLEATLSELNQKTNLMLNIIEEDGDSFAKRSEMLFKRKPKLINMLEDFYKSYRSLAEKYDQLRSELIQASHLRSFSSLNSLKVQTIQKCEKEISTYLKAKSLKAQVETDQESIEEHMEKENIDQGVESDGNVCGKDKCWMKRSRNSLTKICSSGLS
ncbi:protein NETWORKED 4B-like [Pyrus x bretschneideri]|uniref:protein NETWORKED 4B-like n=1 Tax=Pyrus x bretschneideri TaxID=225117 RepID=UPI0005116430|nr:protein NETWORKED 4B-like [Pyrus x bretschneideri]